MLIENLLARVDQLEAELDAVKTRLAELGTRTEVKLATAAPATSPAKGPVNTPASTTKPAAK